MIDMCVTLLEDFFKTSDLEKLTQFSYIFLGKAEKDKAPSRYYQRKVSQTWKLFEALIELFPSRSLCK